MDQTANRIVIAADVRGFLEDLLTTANIGELDEEMHEDLVQELYQRLDNYLTTTIMNNLPPEHMEAFIGMNEAKKPQAEIQQFLSDNMPNVDQVFADAFVQFREMYLGNVASAPQKEQQPT
jgi:hypothetical protein